MQTAGVILSPRCLIRGKSAGPQAHWAFTRLIIDIPAGFVPYTTVIDD